MKSITKIFSFLFVLSIFSFLGVLEVSAADCMCTFKPGPPPTGGATLPVSGGGTKATCEALPASNSDLVKCVFVPTSGSVGPPTGLTELCECKSNLPGIDKVYPETISPVTVSQPNPTNYIYGESDCKQVPAADSTITSCEWKSKETTYCFCGCPASGPTCIEEKLDTKKTSSADLATKTTALQCTGAITAGSCAKPAASTKQCSCTLTVQKKSGSTTECASEVKKDFQIKEKFDFYTTFKALDTKKNCIKGLAISPEAVTIADPCKSSDKSFSASVSVSGNTLNIESAIKCEVKTYAPPASSGGTGSTAKAVDADAVLKARYGEKAPPGYEGPLPNCAFSGTCNDVDDLLLVAIRIGRMIFGFIGSFALLMFVYGGFVWVTSFGNAEKVKKGQAVVVAAVVGLAIALGAYVIIDFLLDSLGVQSSFRVIR